MNNWLVTGGCGFIGAALTARLVSEGCRVRVLDNLSVGSCDRLPPAAAEIALSDCAAAWSPLSLVVGDIRSAEDMVAATRGADVIVHLAANTGVMPSLEDPRADCEANVMGVLNTLEGARRNSVGRFVLASSGAPLGAQTPPVHEEMAPHPMSPYGASKLAGEGYCSAYFHSFGIETVALRFGNVYGPGSGHKQSVVARFIRRALAGDPLEVFGDGQQTRDFVFLDDLLEAICRAAVRPDLGGNVIQVATGTERTVAEIADAVSRLVGAVTGRTVDLTYEGPRPGEMNRNFADISKARRLLDFAPHTSLERGLSLTLESFLASAGNR